MSNPRQAGPITGFIIMLIMTVAGFYVGYKLGWPNYQNAKESKNWPYVLGKVTRSKLTTEISSNSKKKKSRRMYSANIIYSYSINGESLSNSDINVAGGKISSSDKSDAQKVLRRYKNGQEVKVYYSPKDFSISALKAGVKLEHYLLLAVGIVFFAIGIIGLLVSVFKILAVTSVAAVAVESAISERSSNKKSRKTRTQRKQKYHEEGEKIDLDDEMNIMNDVTDSSAEPKDDPWNHEWIILGGKKEWGPYSYNKVVDFIKKKKIKPTHSCYSPAGGDKIQINEILNKKKA
jgi:hypothetical protein